MTPSSLIGKTIHDIVCPLCSKRLESHTGSSSTFRCANEAHQCIVRAHLLNQGLELSRIKLMNSPYFIHYIYIPGEVHCYLSFGNKDHLRLSDAFANLPFKDWSLEELKMLVVFS